MVKSLSRIVVLALIAFSLFACARGFRAGHGVYITNVKISSMPRANPAAPALVNMPVHDAAPAAGAVVASAQQPVTVR